MTQPFHPKDFVEKYLKDEKIDINRTTSTVMVSMGDLYGITAHAYLMGRTDEKAKHEPDEKTCSNCKHVTCDLFTSPCMDCVYVRAGTAYSTRSKWEAKLEPVVKTCSNCKHVLNPAYNLPCLTCVDRVSGQELKNWEAE